jgi:ABC-type polar amino acid transport system ATPase subunit
MLTITNLRKSYKGFEVLKGLNMNLAKRAMYTDSSAKTAAERLPP